MTQFWEKGEVQKGGHSRSRAYHGECMVLSSGGKGKRDREKTLLGSGASSTCKA